MRFLNCARSLLLPVFSMAVLGLLGPMGCTAELELARDGDLLIDEASESQEIYGGVQFASVSNGGRYPNGFSLQVRAPAETRYVVYSSDGYVLGISTQAWRAFAINPYFYMLGSRVIIARAFDAADRQLGEASVQVFVEEEGWTPTAPPPPTNTFAFVAPATDEGTVANPVQIQVTAPAGTRYVVYSADGYVLGVAVDAGSNYGIRVQFSQTGRRVLVARAFDYSDAQLGEISRAVVVAGTGGGSNPSANEPPPPPPPPAVSGRAQVAQRLLDEHHASRLTLWNQSFGRFDGADPLSNIQDTANDVRAKTSCYGSAPCNTVVLQLSLLNAMRSLREIYGFRYFVTSIAGAQHSANSYHYAGRAFDIDEINGQRIYGDSAVAREFMNACWALGAIEVYGPSNDPSGHWDHLHCAF